MSVLAENEAGWIVDHQQEINKTYAMTYVFDEYRLCDFVSERQKVCQFRAVPELFAIRHTYMMDSQFTKSVKANQTSVTSDLVVYRPLCDPTCDLAGKSVVSALQPASKSKVNIFLRFLTCMFFIGKNRNM